MISETIFVERHRPQTLDDIIGHDDIVSQLKRWTEDDSCPHLLFAGKQGTGKTSCVTAFARERYGNDAWRNSVMELNASDERGIDVIRDKVKKYAQQGSGLGSGGKRKIIHLDEADSLTRSAQPALRRIMEDYADTTIFILTCNYLNKIIQPLQSRCVVFSIGGLDDSQVTEVCERVLTKEDIAYSDDVLSDIVTASNGDARSAVNTLQATVSDGELKAENVSSVVSVIDDSIIESLVDDAVKGELETAMERLDEDILKAGINPQLCTSAFLRVIRNREYPAPVKTKMIDKIGEVDWRILNGANPQIHLHKLLADIHIARHLNLDNYEMEAWNN